MEPGRMPHPAAWNALPDVGAAGRQGSEWCIHAPTRKSIACFGAVSLHTRQICSFSVHQVRCQNLRGFSEETAAASLTEQKDGDRLGQRPIPSCENACSAVAQASKGSRTACSCHRIARSLLRSSGFRSWRDDSRLIIATLPAWTRYSLR